MGKSIPSSFARRREKCFQAVRTASESPRSGFGSGLQRRQDRNKNCRVRMGRSAQRTSQ